MGLKKTWLKRRNKSCGNLRLLTKLNNKYNKLNNKLCVCVYVCVGVIVYVCVCVGRIINNTM